MDRGPQRAAESPSHMQQRADRHRLGKEPPKGIRATGPTAHPEHERGQHPPAGPESLVMCGVSGRAKRLASEVGNN